MLTKPVRTLAIAVGIAMLLAQSASATRPDFASADDPSPSSASMVRLPGHVLPALSRAKAVQSGHDSEGSPITLTLVLKRSDQASFDRYLHSLYDKHSKNFHHFLTQAEITARFGPSQHSYEAVLAYLRAKGFQLVRGSANHLTITVRGTRAEAENAFDLRIRDYRIGEQRFYANDTDPILPNVIASQVQALAGLSNLAKPHSSRLVIQLFLDVLCYIVQIAPYTDRTTTYQERLQERLSAVKNLTSYVPDIPPFCALFPDSPLCHLFGGDVQKPGLSSPRIRALMRIFRRRAP